MGRQLARELCALEGDQLIVDLLCLLCRAPGCRVPGGRGWRVAHWCKGRRRRVQGSRRRSNRRGRSNRRLAVQFAVDGGGKRCVDGIWEEC